MNRCLFQLPCRKPMAFKGGTSLSKIYKAIDRFSEAIDVTDHYKKGNQRPKVEWVFRVAGHGEGTYDLRHITRRKEYLDFFAQGGGECRIVTDPGCASSQTRKV